MNNKHLYSIGLPIYVLIFLPPLLLCVPLSLLLFCFLSMLVISLFAFKRIRGAFLARTVPSAYGCAMISHILGSVVCGIPPLMISQYLDIKYDFFTEHASYVSDPLYHFSHSNSFIPLGFFAAVTCAFLLNYHLTFKLIIRKRFPLMKRQRFFFSLLCALATAPYVFFIPDRVGNEWFDWFMNLFNVSDWIRQMFENIDRIFL
ncbi:MAG: hypothetical protein IJ598_06290 [Ruminococcus sp.]|nr:hypothetical protein [Ruminococcus sp.]